MDMSDVILEQIGELFLDVVDFKKGKLFSEDKLKLSVDKSVLEAAAKLEMSVTDFIYELVMIDEEGFDKADPDLINHIVFYYQDTSPDEDIVTEDIINLSVDYLLQNRKEEK